MRRRNSASLFAFNPEPERLIRRNQRQAETETETPSDIESEPTSPSLSATSSPINTPPRSPPRKTMPRLSDEGMPSAEEVPTGTLNPNLTTTNFKVDPSFYNLIHKEQFGGAPSEDPARHINRFCDLCQLITHEGVTQDQLRRMMFAHSLRDKASFWLETVSAATSNTWATLVLAFYRKFFPPERTANLRMQITGFKQRLNETLYDAWERFKSLEKQCPHHGFGEGFMAMTFYNALTPDSRRILDSAANGMFSSVEVAEARNIIETMASHSIQYGQSNTTVGAIGDDSYFQQSMTSQIEDLKAQLASLKVNTAQPTPPPISPIPSPIGAINQHYSLDNYGYPGTQEQVAAYQNYQQGVYNNFNQQYNRPNPQYNSLPIGQSSQPIGQGPYQHPNKPQPFKPPTFTDMNDLRTMLMGMQKSQEHLIAQVAKMDQEKSSAIKSIETQIAQLAASQAQRQQGQLPSQPSKTTDQVHHVNAITLRSGITYEVEDRGESSGKNAEKQKNEVNSQRDPTTDRPTLSADRYVPSRAAGNVAEAGLGKGKQVEEAGIKIRLPYPSRLKQKSLYEEQFGKFKEVLTKLNITIPFLDLVLQVPSYTKFLKDLLNRKKTLPKVETVAFTERCSAPRQSDSPSKLADPGSFSIPCVIGTINIENALCDLGASVSVLPLSLARKMGLTQFKSSNMTIQMADRTTSRPLGLLEDVPVKMGGFYIPVDFVVLDIPEDANIPIILGRPFLHTTGAVIDVAKKTLTFKVGGELLVFKPSDTPRSPLVVKTDSIVRDQNRSLQDPTYQSGDLTCQSAVPTDHIHATTDRSEVTTDRPPTPMTLHDHSLPLHVSPDPSLYPDSVAAVNSAYSVNVMSPSHIFGDTLETFQPLNAGLDDSGDWQGYPRSTVHAESKLTGLQSVLWPNHPYITGQTFWRPRVAYAEDIPFI